MPRIAFFDIDGTIMTEDYRVPQSAVDAIHTAQKNGVLCVICSGRPYAHIDPKVRAIGFDGYICSCGMHVVFQDKTLLHATTSQAVTKQAIALARLSECDVIYESEEGMFFDKNRPMNAYMKKSYEHFGSVGLNVDGDIDAPDYAFDKIFVWTNNDNPHMEEFLVFLRQHFDLIAHNERTFECVSPGCSKETGIRTFLDYVHADKEETYAFGDGLNDLAMMDYVTHTAAMGNAVPELKNHVDYVTADINENGLALAMHHFDLI